MKKTAFNWTRLLRTMIALLVIMSMLLCGCASAGGDDDDDEGGKKNEGTSADSGLIKGDGDGKLEAEDVVDNVTGIYGSLLGAIGGDKNSLTNGGYSMDMTVVLGDALLSQLEAMMEYEGMEADISWFKSLGFAMEVIYNDTLSQMNLEAKLNGTGIMSMEAIVDAMNSSVYFCVPELNDGFVGGYVDMGYTQEELMEMYNQTMEMMNEYADVVEALPTEKELNTLLDRYMDVAKAALGAPESGTETLTYGDVSMEVNTTTYTITTTKLVDIVEALLNTAKTDAELETVLDEFCAWYNEKMAQEQEGYEAIDMHDLLMQAVEEGLQSMAEVRADLEDGTNEDMEALTFTNYLADEKSVGFALSVNGGYESTSVYMYNLEQDGNTAFVLNMAETMTLMGTGTTSGGKASGNYTLSMYGDEMLYLEIEDFDTKALKKGEIKGTLRLRFGEEMLYNISNDFITTDTVIELLLNLGGGKTAMAINLYNGDALLFGVELSVKALSGSVKVPSNYTDVEDEEGIQNWVSNMSFDRVLRNLRSAGVSSELVDMLEESLNQAMGG